MHISANLALSADGKIAPSLLETRSENDRRLTSTEDHTRLKQLRLGKDALLVGMGTLIADHMTLTSAEEGEKPLRCVISRHNTIPHDHPIFLRDGGTIHLCTTEATVATQDQVQNHHLNLADFLKKLASLGVHNLHCEGGGQLIHALAELDVLDTIHLTLAGHTLIGGALAPTLSGVLSEFLPASRAYTLTQIETNAEQECFVTYTKEEKLLRRVIHLETNKANIITEA